MQENPLQTSASPLTDAEENQLSKSDGLSAELSIRQKEIDAIKGADFMAFRERGLDLPETEKANLYARFPVLKRYDEAYGKVFREVSETKVSGRTPAVWFVYNMGLVVKTRKTVFSIDLSHRQDLSSVPFCDFACYTHNHDDHCDDGCLDAFNAAGKLIISNFEANEGAKRTHGGYGGFTRRPRTFTIGDVRIETHVAAHNSYLLDFTMPLEITIGDYRIYHSGDMCYHYEIMLNRPGPDLWIVHPYCGMNVGDGVQMVCPKLTVIAHLQELGHDKWRWSYEDGLRAVRDCNAQGYAAIMPTWGERIV